MFLNNPVGKTITPTPTRSRSASRSSSPQPTPPTSPKISSHLISSPSSAFAIKKSQEIAPPPPSIADAPFDTSVSSAFSRRAPESVVDESGTSSKASPDVSGIDQATGKKEGDKGGSKLKLSLHASQGQDLSASKQSLRFTQELIKPLDLEEPADKKAASPTGLLAPIAHSKEDFLDIPSTREREDSISHELAYRRNPSIGGEGNDEVSEAMHTHDGGVSPYLPNTPTNSSPGNSSAPKHVAAEEVSLHRRQTHTRGNSNDNLNFAFNQTNTNKDPFQTMLNSKYTSYGRDVETHQRDARRNQHPQQGLQDVLRKWWILFCILFILSIARFVL